MKRAILISLGVHLTVMGAAVAWTGKWAIDRLPRERVYTVNIVGIPGIPGAPGGGRSPGSGGNPAARSATAAKTGAARVTSRSGVKVDKAPSDDPTAPKGVRRPVQGASGAPGQTAGQKGGQAAGGRPGGKGGIPRLENPFPFPDYLQDLLSWIEANWERPFVVGEKGALRATVFFRILKDGGIVDVVVEAGSGALVFDRAAMEAVVNAGPLPPLPEGFEGDHLGVHLDFE